MVAARHWGRGKRRAAERGESPFCEMKGSGSWLHGSTNLRTLSHALKNGQGGPWSVFPRMPYKRNHVVCYRQGRAASPGLGLSVVQAVAHTSSPFLFAARGCSAMLGYRGRSVCSPVEGYLCWFHFLAVTNIYVRKTVKMVNFMLFILPQIKIIFKTIF